MVAKKATTRVLYEEWKPKFAWLPVKINGTIAWFKKIMARRVFIAFPGKLKNGSFGVKKELHRVEYKFIPKQQKGNNSDENIDSRK